MINLTRGVPSRFHHVCLNSEFFLYHPDPLRDEVLTYAHWALSRNTNRTYNSGEKRFTQFCLMNHLLSPTGNILPASERTLTYFASYLARTVRHSTIKLYLVAVCNLRIRSGFSDPVVDRPLLKKGYFMLSRFLLYPTLTDLFLKAS